jgi:hypothetical protein
MMNANLQGSSATLSACGQAPDLGVAIPAADLATLTGMPHEPELLEDLRVAACSYTGFGADSPLIAEIVSHVVAAIVTAVLTERVPSDSLPVPQPGSQVWRRAVSATVQTWRDRPTEGPAQEAGLPGIADAARMSQARMPPAGMSLAGMSAVSAGGQICAVFAVDIVGFTRPDRDDDIRRYLHERLYAMLQGAFDGSAIPWTACWHEDRGDGALVVIPPGVSGMNLVGPLPERLRALVRRHNHVSSEAARIQLRAAAHFGLVEHDGHGFVGSDVNLLFRMLDAPTLKRALAASRADLALIVSDHVYRTFVCRHPSLMSPDDFEAIKFQVKQAKFQAWRHLSTVQNLLRATRFS